MAKDTHNTNRTTYKNERASSRRVSSASSIRQILLKIDKTLKYIQGTRFKGGH